MNLKQATTLEDLAGQVLRVHLEGVDAPECLGQMLEAIHKQLYACATLIRDELDRNDELEDLRQANHWASLSPAERDEAIRKAR